MPARHRFPSRHHQTGATGMGAVARYGVLLILGLLVAGFGSCFGGGGDGVSNVAPVANAGLDQTVPVGTTVELDGSASTDVDGDALRYYWSVISTPLGSAATLSDHAAVTPSCTVDMPGTYVFSLSVYDGVAFSTLDMVTITTLNSAPLADAGPDQTVALAALVQLDGTGSRDADNDPLTYAWTLINVPENSTASLDSPSVVNPGFVADLPGTYIAQLVVNDSYQDSAPDTVQIDTLNSQPVADAGPDQEAFVDDTVVVDGSGSSDADGDALAYQWSLLTTPDGSGATLADADQQASSFTADIEGEYVAQLIVNDGQLDSDPDTALVTVQVQVSPDSDGDGLTDAEEEVLGTFPDDPDSDDDGYLDGEEVDAGTDPLDPDSYPDGIPPNPEAIAPALDPTVVTTVYAGSKFLYTGTPRIQTGMLEETIDPVRTAVIRGRVMTRDGAPLSGVSVTILNHPEYGQTRSRADGMFDLVVNGGGYYTLNYAKQDFLTAQRTVDTPWQDYVRAPEVALIGLDAAVTTVNMGAAELQVARGSEVTDEDGTRTATLLFPAGTTAELVLPDGRIEPVAGSLDVRATEYTVGPNGPMAMPAELPPTSGYTYAVELSADEAIAAGATEVRFSQPVYSYVEDFIGFPVGSAVPVGFYDRQKAQWIASENGRVIKIVAINGGLAELDTDGDDTADDAATLAALNVTLAEQQRLATLYSAGQALWRVPITHFSPGDYNWPYGLAEDAEPPPETTPPWEPERTCKQEGSIIACQTQVLGETLGMTGVPFTINYRSDRVFGRDFERLLPVAVSGPTVPESLKRIEVRIGIAGRVFSQSFAPLPNMTFEFLWDGEDAYGRLMQGSQPVVAEVTYVYAPVYYGVSSDWGASFAAVRGASGGGVGIVESRATSEYRVSRRYKGELGSLRNESAALGGWSLDAHHAYDPRDKTLYLGYGEQRSAAAIAATIETAVTAENLGALDSDLATAAEGGLYVSSGGSGVALLNQDGELVRVAGHPFARGFGGDGGPATDALLSNPIGLDVGPDGSLYIADKTNQRIRKVDPQGIIHTVAGSGSHLNLGDGGPAVEANLLDPQDVAVAADGTFYIADTRHHRVRRVGTDGIITTIAGTGAAGNSGNGGLAIEANISPNRLATDGAGDLYIVSGYFWDQQVRRIRADGIIEAVAGGGANRIDDGIPATEARFEVIGGVAVGGDGSVYLAGARQQGDWDWRVYRVDPDGTLVAVAGYPQQCPSSSPLTDCGWGGPALLAHLNLQFGLTLDQDNQLHMLGRQGLNKIALASPSVEAGVFAIASEDGTELYDFDAGGRHLRTRHTLTAAVLYEFAYDGEGRLTSITDGDGNVTSISRDEAGAPAAIVGPFGVSIELTLNEGGYLASITNPADEAFGFEYTADGLLTVMTNPKGHTYSNAYASDGRLASSTDPLGGTRTLTRSDFEEGFEVAFGTPLGRTTNYRVEELENDDIREVVTFADGTANESIEGKDGGDVLTTADGSVLEAVYGADPRFGMRASVTKSASYATPGGITSTVAYEQSVSLSDEADFLSLDTLTETVSINGDLYSSAYESLTSTFTSTTPAGRSAFTTVDAQGRVTQHEISGLLPTSLTYSDRGLLTGIVQGAGDEERAISLAYNLLGRVESMIDPESRTTGFEYDAAGRLTALSRPDGAVVSYEYDANGDITALTPPGRPAHGFSYSATGLLTEYDPPAVGIDADSTLYAYNEDRQLLRITQPGTRIIDFAYDDAGRVASVTIPRGEFVYSYDPVSGNLVSVLAPGEELLSYSFDGFLLTGQAWTGTVAGNVAYTYDNDFQLASVSVNNGAAISYQYDSDGLLTQAGQMGYTRNPENGLLTNAALGQVSDTWAYNAFGELESSGTVYDTSDIFSVQYVRDKLGRITEKTETVEGVTTTYGYAYDLAGRLVEVRENGVLTDNYTYDGNGNRLSHNAINGAYDEQDRLLQYGDATYSYSANGELLTKSQGGDTTSYAYDAFGNLISVTLPDATEIEYLIDGQNRRIGKKVNGVLVQSFLYLGEINPVAELDGDGNLVAIFIYGEAGYVPEYMMREGEIFRVITDQLGSPRIVIDVTSSEIAQRIDYDEFGNMTLDTNPGMLPFRFAGGLYDSHTALIRFGARDYDSQIGRWTAKDPVRFAGGQLNLYSYASNDPVNFRDPSGEKTFKDYEDEFLDTYEKKKDIPDAKLLKEKYDRFKEKLKPQKGGSIATRSFHASVNPISPMRTFARRIAALSLLFVCADFITAGPAQAAENAMTSFFWTSTASAPTSAPLGKPVNPWYISRLEQRNQLWRLYTANPYGEPAVNAWVPWQL